MWRSLRRSERCSDWYRVQALKKDCRKWRLNVGAGWSVGSSCCCEGWPPPLAGSACSNPSCSSSSPFAEYPASFLHFGWQPTDSSACVCATKKKEEEEVPCGCS